MYVSAEKNVRRPLDLPQDICVVLSRINKTSVQNIVKMA